AAGPLGVESILARRPRTDTADIDRDLELVREGIALLRDAEGFDIVAAPEIRSALDRLRIEGSVLDGLDLVALKNALTASRLVAAELKRVSSRGAMVGALAVPVPERRIETRLETSLDEQGELVDNASPGLLRARRAVQAAREKLIKKLESMLRGADPGAVPSGASVTMRNGRYVIPVRRDARVRPTGIVHDESGSAGTLFIEPADAIDLGNALREAVSDEAREVLAVLRELTDLLRPHHEEIRAAHAMCVAADDLQARARYARSVDADVPAIGAPGSSIELRKARHPVLLAQAGDAVSFDLVLDQGERTLVISGPNAGGKTVLLKAVGLSVALVQCGIAPPLGTGSRVPVCTRIIADIGDHQSIAANLSTFSAHLATLREIFASADGGTLVLLDELGSGTDPSEGAALAWATLEALHARGTLTLATTHLGALKTLASALPGVVNGSMEFDSATLSPTYRFQKGVPGRSYGLAIARRLGVDSAVLARAEAQVPERERALDALLHDVERRDQAIRAREAEVEEREEVAASRLENLEARETLASERETELRRQEKDADQRARRQARDYLLEARKRVEEAIAAAAGEAKDARRIVEESIGALREDSGRVAAGRRAGGLAGGQHVRLSTGTKARVEEIRGDGKVVLVAGSVRMTVPEEEIAEVLSPPAGPPVRPPAHTESDASFEIDLRGMRADEAEGMVLSALDAAISADNPFLRIIHGKGTGAVRERVHSVLKGDRRVSRYALAPANQGGSGATIVEFR
ncbi:MAG TPA: Smr/MutS family protein, partial [Gemmatimonadales bacterium]|nr:Smr/MutS family protein [Gemmatimonadales bacterium]